MIDLRSGAGRQIRYQLDTTRFALQARLRPEVAPRCRQVVPCVLGHGLCFLVHVFNFARLPLRAWRE